jgi:4-amino-4-deoxy-L-arabinose transferase-like glycosyltransferase
MRPDARVLHRPYDDRFVVSLALFIRLVLVVVCSLQSSSGLVLVVDDTQSYIEPATEILASGRFETDSQPEIFRTPGYPLLLALGMALGPVELVTLVLQIVLSVLTTWLTYRLAIEVTQRRLVAVTAASLYALEPLSILYTSILLTETLFTTFFVGFAYLMARAVRELRNSDVVIAAILLVAATYIRPVTIYLPILCAVLLISVAVRTTTPSIRRGVIAALTLLFVSYAGIFPWIARNHFVSHYTGFSTVADVNLFYYHALEIRAQNEGATLKELQQREGWGNESVLLMRRPDFARLNPGERISRLRKEALTILRNHPLQTIVMWAKGSLRTLFGSGAGTFIQRIPRLGELPRRPTVVTLNVILLPPLPIIYALALFGVVAPSLHREHRWLFVILTVYFVLVSGGITGYSRFRLPLIPIFSILAAHGATIVYEKLRLRWVPSLR